MINKCSKDKILNIETNRCVNKKGKIGKKILNEKIKSKCINIKLKWNNNSCYLDSILISLFHKKNKIIENIILNSKINKLKDEKSILIAKKIKKELKQLYKLLSNKQNNEDYIICKKLRTLLDEFDKIEKTNIIDDKDNWLYSQLDIYDFMRMLLYIFKIKENTLKIKENNKINYTNFNKIIDIDFLYDNKGNNKKLLKIKDIYPINIRKIKLTKENVYINEEGKKQNYYIKKEEIIKGDILFINIYRNTLNIKNDIKIIPIEKMKLKENKFKLNLTSIIIHYGSDINSGHYIVLYKCQKNKKWYEYDDMNGIKEIGKFNSIIKNNNYIKNIVGLLYIK